MKRSITTFLNILQHTVISGLPVILVLMLVGGCKKADNYYAKLYAQPELLTVNINPRYTVGDTLKLMGRLNPQNNLIIRINGVQADIKSISRDINLYVPPGKFKIDSIDIVKTVITASMGIGPGKSITINSAGITINGPAIDIVESGSTGILSDSLKAASYYTLPAGSKPLYCQNGKGSIYLWNSDNTLTLIKKNGITQKIFDNRVLTDNFGAFTVTKFNSGGVNPQETLIYFSVLTTDASTDNAGYFIYRLCKYDVGANKVTVLNRTLYAKDASKHTLAAAQPFEGSIGQIKLFELSGIYPDSKGNLYFKVNSSILGRLTADRSCKYVYKARRYDSDPGYQNFIPEIINPATGMVSTDEQLLNLYPGATGTRYIRAVSPEEDLLYPLFSLTLQTPLNLSYYPIYFFSPQGGLTNDPGVINDPEEYQWGYMPLPGNRLLLLMNQDAETRQEWRSLTPVWVVQDYEKNQARRYTPGKFAHGSYKMQPTDLLLNYDEEGMVYMTANTQKVIIKTALQ